VSADNSPNLQNRGKLMKLQKLTDLMDKAFVVPGTNIRFGLDPILGLIPVVGDTLTTAVAVYIYSFAEQTGVPWRKRMQMLWNIFIDWLVGLVPIFGDFFDVRFKANSRNMRIIMAYANSPANIEASDDRLT